MKLKLITKLSIVGLFSIGVRAGTTEQELQQMQRTTQKSQQAQMRKELRKRMIRERDLHSCVRSIGNKVGESFVRWDVKGKSSGQIKAYGIQKIDHLVRELDGLKKTFKRTSFERLSRMAKYARIKNVRNMSHLQLENALINHSKKQIRSIRSCKKAFKSWGGNYQKEVDKLFANMQKKKKYPRPFKPKMQKFFKSKIKLNSMFDECTLDNDYIFCPFGTFKKISDQSSDYSSRVFSGRHNFKKYEPIEENPNVMRDGSHSR